MKTVTLNQALELFDKNLLPKADFSNFDSFLNSINDEDLSEMILLYESKDEDKLEFLSYTIGLLFMNEYDMKECETIDFENIAPQFYRQCAAELMDRGGLWDKSKEDRRLVPTNEPL